MKEHKIHFYEYMEVELLQEYIKAGIQYFINAIINAYPSLVPLRYYSEEISTFIHMAKDLYFLLTKNSLYCEYFYGLERTSEKSKMNVAKHIIVWFVIPYLFRKLDDYFRREQQEQENGRRFRGIKKVFMKVYPYLYAILGIIQIVFKFKYLIHENSKFYSLEYYATKTQTKYIETEEEPYHYPLFTLMKSPGLLLLLVSHKVLSLYYSGKKSLKRKRVKDE